MKRLIFISLLLAALSTQGFGQGDRQLTAQNFLSATEVTSIPLSDTLVEKVKNPDNGLDKSRRELSGPGADSAAAGEKKRYWVEAEYLNWRIKESVLPPLVQTRIPSGTTGAYGEVLLGGGEVDPGTSGGGRLTAGLWLNQARTLGLEASYFYLGPRSVNQSAGGTGECAPPCLVRGPVITRPFINVLPTTVLYHISLPFAVSGNVTYSLASHLQGAELNSVYDLGERGFRGVRLIGGFRFLDVKERLTVIDTHFHSGLGILGMGDDAFFLVTDEFATRNRFYGAQGGIQTEFRPGRLRLGFTGKVALGGVRQLVNIGGSTFRAFRTARDTRVGGFLAVESNIGRYDRSKLAILPEGKASIGYQFTDYLQAFAGYDFLYINRVARPAEQIDLNINWHNIPTLLVIEGPIPRLREPRLPAFSFSDSPFWAQGLTVGLRLGF